MLSLKSLNTSADNITLTHAGETIDTRIGADGQPEALGIGREIIGHLVFGGVRACGSGEGHAVEAIELRRGEQTQRIPALAPGVAYARMRVENHKLHAQLGKMIADR